METGTAWNEGGNVRGDRLHKQREAGDWESVEMGWRGRSDGRGGTSWARRLGQVGGDVFEDSVPTRTHTCSKSLE